MSLKPLPLPECSNTKMIRPIDEITQTTRPTTSKNDFTKSSLALTFAGAATDSAAGTVT
jgi:hypothetical protein